MTLFCIVKCFSKLKQTGQHLTVLPLDQFFKYLIKFSTFNNISTQMSNKLSFSVFNWFWLVEIFLYHWRDRCLLVFPPLYWKSLLTLGLRELLWQPWKLSHNPFPCTFSNLNLIRDNLVHLRYALFQPPEISPKAKFSIYPKSHHLDGDNFYWKSWSVTMNTSTWWF